MHEIRHTVVRKKDIYEIVRPDGSIVNEAKYSEIKYAKKHLEMLIAFGWAEGKENES